MLSHTRIQASLLFVVALAGLQQQAVVLAQDVCEICGCDACPPGFVVGNTAGLIIITQEIFDEFGAIEVPPNPLNPEPSTLEETLTTLGFGLGAALPCSILETAATSGIFPIESCTDQLRLNPIIRDTCGCPPVPAPPTDAPVVAPTDAPVADPTEEPTAEPTEEPTAEPTVEETAEPTAEPTVGETAEPTAEPTVGETAEPTAEPTVGETAEPTAEPTVGETAEPTAEPTENPTDPPVDEPTEPPVDTPTDAPVVTPTAPVVAPTDPPVDAPTEPPVDAPTDPPAPVPTSPPMMTVVATDPPVMPVAPPPEGGIPFPELERCTTMRRQRKQ